MNKLEENFDKISWGKVFHENENNANNSFQSLYKTLTKI